jgi:hypothetical protein
MITWRQRVSKEIEKVKREVRRKVSAKKALERPART